MDNKVVTIKKYIKFISKKLNLTNRQAAVKVREMIAKGEIGIDGDWMIYETTPKN